MWEEPEKFTKENVLNCLEYYKEIYCDYPDMNKYYDTSKPLKFKEELALKASCLATMSHIKLTEKMFEDLKRAISDMEE